MALQAVSINFLCQIPERGTTREKISLMLIELKKKSQNFENKIQKDDQQRNLTLNLK